MRILRNLRLMQMLREMRKQDEMKDFKLGKEYKDKISGFIGVAVAKTEWINGCVRITLQPKLDKDGKIQDNVCLDIEQLEPTGNEVTLALRDGPDGEPGVPAREPVVRAVGSR